MVHDLAQRVQAREQGFFLVLLEKELRIGKPGPDHPLIAANDSARVRWRDVAHHQKVVAQAPALVEQGEVFLIGLHGQDQTLLRHAQKVRIELAREHIGMLHQCTDLIQERLVFEHAQRFAQTLRERPQLFANRFAPTLKTGHHPTLLKEHTLVVAWVCHGQARGQCLKTMALGVIRRLKTQCTQGQHFFAIQGQQAMHRSHKMHAAPARQGAVAVQLITHELGDGQRAQALAQGLLRTFGEGGASLGGFGPQIDLFAIIDFFQGRHAQVRQPHGRELFGKRRRGLTLRVQAHALRHQLLLDGFGAGLWQDTLYAHGQTPRRGKTFKTGRGGGEPLRHQTVKNPLCKGSAQCFQSLRGQLFGQEFNEQGLAELGRLHRCRHAGTAFDVRPGIAGMAATHWAGAMGNPRRSRLSR